MASLFISYSRKDIAFAHQLTTAFEGQDLDFWIDWEDIPPTVEWWQEIEKGIEEADIFLFLLSPDSVTSKYCKKEIEHAVKNGKRLIPIVVRDISADKSPVEISILNWILLRENDDFSTGFGKLMTAIKTDYEWVQIHRRLQVRALEWERGSKDKSFLLRGKDLQTAEAQLVTNAGKNPTPTDLQTDYVIKSRQASDRQRRITSGIAVVGVIALAVLAVFGFVQANHATDNAIEAQNQAAKAQAASTLAVSNEAIAVANEKLADERADIARAGEIAAQAATQQGKNYPLALLLSIEAYKRDENISTRNNLLSILQAKPQLMGFLSHHENPEYHNPVLTIAFSPDGKIIASGSNQENFITLWDTETHQPIGQPLELQGDRVYDVTFSPNNKTLATLGSSLLLWDLATRNVVGEFSIDIASDEMAFSPDGSLLAAGGCYYVSGDCIEGEIILWDAATYQVVDRLKTGHNAEIENIAFSSDGKVLASNDYYSVILWDIESHKQLGIPFDTFGMDLMAFSPDGKTLALARFDDNTITLWDVATHQPIERFLTGFGDRLRTIILSPDNTILAAGSCQLDTFGECGSGEIILWNVITRQPIGDPLVEHQGAVSSLAFSPDSHTIASGGCRKADNSIFCNQEEIILWDATASQPIGQSLLEFGYDMVISLSFSPDSKILASSRETFLPDQDNTLILWDVDSRRSIGDPISTGGNFAIATYFSQDGKAFDTVYANGSIKTWRISEHQSISRLSEYSLGAMDHVILSPDGKNLAAVSCKTYVDNECNQTEILILDVTTHEFLSKAITEYKEISGLAFSHDNKYLAIGNYADKTIIIWDIAGHQPLGKPFTGYNVSYLAFSPDDKTLASESGGTIVLWDIISRQPISKALIVPSNGNGTAIAFSPDGKVLAWAGTIFGITDGIFGEIILLEAATLRPIGQPLTGHSAAISALVFSPDNKHLASASMDGSMIIWDIDPQDWVDIACLRAGRNLTHDEWEQYLPEIAYPTRQENATCPQWPLETATRSTKNLTP
jgi:WD40 repeat protein